MPATFRQRFVRAIYANHNDSKVIDDTLREMLARQGDDALMLNIGAGETRLHAKMMTLELEAGPGIDHVGSVEALPFADATLDLIVTQEVLEHVSDPFKAMQEIYRVLKVDGESYVQLPFIIGYHPCPADYWRFTQSGIVQLAEQAGFKNVVSKRALGPSIGFYRIAVEFFALLFSRPIPKLYHAMKGAAALVLYPVKWLDILLNSHPEADRIGGGYLIILKK